MGVRDGADIPTIPKPNSSPQNELGTLLNLACLKATGSFLPSSFYTQDWYYKIDAKGKSGYYKPSSIPALLSNPFGSMMPDGYEQSIKRRLIVDELNAAFNPKDPVLNKDSVIFILIPFIRLANTRHQFFIPNDEVILGGFGGIIPPQVVSDVMDACGSLYEKSGKLFSYDQISDKCNIHQDINLLMRVSNFNGNHYYDPTNYRIKMGVDYEVNVKDNVFVFNILSTIASAVMNSDTQDYLFDWLDRIYPTPTNHRQKVRDVLRFRRKDIRNPSPSASDVNYEGISQSSKQQHFTFTRQRQKSHRGGNRDKFVDTAFISEFHACPLWHEKLKGEDLCYAYNAHTLDKLVTQAGHLPVKQLLWTPAFWLLNAEYRDDITSGRSSWADYDYSLGTNFAHRSARRGNKKVWDRVKKDSASLKQFVNLNPKGWEGRYLESLMKWSSKSPTLLSLAELKVLLYK